MALVCACSQKDMSGRKITALEERALDTCNDQLESKFKGMLGTVSAPQAVFDSSGNDQIGIAWNSERKAGKGVIVCFTDGNGQTVIGWNIDGLQVHP